MSLLMFLYVCQYLFMKHPFTPEAFCADIKNLFKWAASLNKGLIIFKLSLVFFFLNH